MPEEISYNDRAFAVLQTLKHFNISIFCFVFARSNSFRSSVRIPWADTGDLKIVTSHSSSIWWKEEDKNNLCNGNVCHIPVAPIHAVITISCQRQVYVRWQGQGMKANLQPSDRLSWELTLGMKQWRVFFFTLPFKRKKVEAKMCIASFVRESHIWLSKGATKLSIYWSHDQLKSLLVQIIEENIARGWTLSKNWWKLPSVIAVTSISGFLFMVRSRKYQYLFPVTVVHETPKTSP